MLGWDEIPYLQQGQIVPIPSARLDTLLGWFWVVYHGTLPYCWGGLRNVWLFRDWVSRLVTFRHISVKFKIDHPHNLDWWLKGTNGQCYADHRLTVHSSVLSCWDGAIVSVSCNNCSQSSCFNQFWKRGKCTCLSWSEIVTLGATC